MSFAVMALLEAIVQLVLELPLAGVGTLRAEGGKGGRLGNRSGQGPFAARNSAMETDFPPTDPEEEKGCGD